MGRFFACDYAGAPFDLFGAAHLGGLLALLTFNLLLTRFASALTRTRGLLRLTLALTLYLNESAWHLWKVACGQWTVQTMLPLQLCSVFVWLSGLMLLRRSYRLYELTYFMGIGGALQALATPDLGPYGFPHFRFFQTFLSHGLIITSAVYMTAVEGFRPTWKSMLRAAGWGNLYALGIYFVNLALGSNYLMLNARPGVPSLLDYLPDWPWYLPWMEGIGLATILLLFLPFTLSGGSQP
ncbi:MAG: hypothetical protein Fur0043_00810 [Anaerolineales bacterium]